MYACMYVVKAYGYAESLNSHPRRRRKKKGEEYLDVGPQMVVPSLSALLSYSPMQHLSNMRPFSHSMLFNQVH